MGDGGLLVWEQLPAIRLILLTLYWAYFRKTRTRAGIDGHHEKKNNRPRVGGKKRRKKPTPKTEPLMSGTKIILTFASRPV